MATIPASRMFLIKKSLSEYRRKHPDQPTYDASQGDGGASLSGVSQALYDRANQLQSEHGSAYDMPFGTQAFRRSVIEDYWQLNSDTGIESGNVLAAMGGRDGLLKAYEAMLALGHGRQGDAVVVSRVPWISYNWGPYGVGANVMLAPGDPAVGWGYTEESLKACADFASRSGRKIAGVIITNPDNPTGLTQSPESQAALAKSALSLGAAFVLFDWVYHYVTDEQPMDLNKFLSWFSPQERERLIFMDAITKSLGGSNVRNAHLIAAKPVIDFIVARASHGVIPSFYSQAVAMAAYEMGFAEACRPIVEPTNASRLVLKEYLEAEGFTHIIGKGYYAFIHVGEWLAQKGWKDTEPLGQYLAEDFGVAVVPGVYFSPYGGEWLRFSYATPPERTLGAVQRLSAGLAALAG
jgi:aspartate/methionine/tyrosine aminotransferase